MNEPLWSPTEERIEGAQVTRFRRGIETRHGVTLPDHRALHQWSVEHSEEFWQEVWNFGEVIALRAGDTVLENPQRMPGARWFPDARLNFAENLLRRRDDLDALVFRGEDRVSSRLSHRQMYEQVSRLSQALRAEGLAPGERVAAYLPNLPDTVVAMLAASSIGATWCSGSPDFGVQGILDRFGQVEPTVLFATDGYYYNGKVIDCLAKLAEVREALPSLRRVIVIPYVAGHPDIRGIRDAVLLEDYLEPHRAGEIEFTQLPFDHPLYILFTSGTTGVPKCIVHGAGGTLLQHIKEHRLHADIATEDRVFYFTTCGWMMWNWLVSGLACGATLLLYDGSPFHPDGNVLFDFAAEERMNVFGTSAKYIDALKKADLRPKETHDLAELRSLLSTGSPLVPESFDYVYEKVKSDLCLSSISGGTDIVSCFVLGSTVLPVWRGEIQCRGLGMAVEVWDDDGRPVRQQKGELVCTKTFPSMPVGFWNDPDGSRYHAAYFERFPEVWCHGDFVALTEHEGIVIYGRSDAVLNPGGVRIGTAEIYRQVEQIDEVVEALVIGQDWQDDVRVVLFVRLRDGVELDDALIKRVRERIRRHASPRHVPAKILKVKDIPRTKSGKIVELAVREVVHGRPVKNVESLANPSALEEFRNRAELGEN
jgi:acetoacetyl-CoA synthetase